MPTEKEEKSETDKSTLKFTSLTSSIEQIYFLYLEFSGELWFGIHRESHFFWGKGKYIMGNHENQGSRAPRQDHVSESRFRVFLLI